jgi:tryptophan-rich sensory protein
MSGVASTRGRAIATAAAAALAVAGLGALTTDLGPWYAQLKEPAWKPPDLLFGPAWTTIFACTAAAGVIAWSRRRTTVRPQDAEGERRAREWMLVAFALNATLNLVWSLLFFRLHRPDWALVEVVALWLSIVLLIVLVGRRSKPAAWLLAPYLAWVSFAALLNHAVVRLNAPFGSA